MLPHVPPHQEPQPAQQDQGAGGEVHQRVIHVMGEGAVRLPEAHQVEARVAEGGHAVENSVPNAPCHAQLRDEPEGQQHRPQPLDGGGAAQDIAQEGERVAEPLGADALHHQRALAQADLPAQEQERLEHQRHVTQPAHLDEDQQNDLAQQVELGPGVRHHKPRHAGGGGGGEQAVQKGQSAPGAVGKGQHEQQRPRHDDAQKAQGDDLVGGQADGFLFHGHDSSFRSLSHYK